MRSRWTGARPPTAANGGGGSSLPDFSGTWESATVEVCVCVCLRHWLRARSGRGGSIGAGRLLSVHHPLCLCVARHVFQNLDAFLEARGVPYLKRLIAGASHEASRGGDRERGGTRTTVSEGAFAFVVHPPGRHAEGSCHPYVSGWVPTSGKPHGTAPHAHPAAAPVRVGLRRCEHAPRRWCNSTSAAAAECDANGEAYGVRPGATVHV
jgi:hypothetical protein